MNIRLTVNAKPVTTEIPVNLTLCDLLRTLGYWSVRHGCETGDCGNCAVLVDGVAVNSCLMLAAQAEGKTVRTYESYEAAEELNPLREALLDFADPECNYCVSGMFLSLKALIDKIAYPTEEEVVDALSGHVCRCSKDALPVEGILEAVRRMRGRF